jgi:hypothetical protein
MPAELLKADKRLSHLAPLYYLDARQNLVRQTGPHSPISPPDLEHTNTTQVFAITHRFTQKIAGGGKAKEGGDGRGP